MEHLKPKIYYNFILAICKNKGIGFKGTLPWKLSRDMAHFKTVTTHIYNESECISELITTKMLDNAKDLFKTFPNKTPTCLKNAVVMGKNTWQSIPKQFQPLRGRINIVVSRSEEFHQENPPIEDAFYAVRNLEEFFNVAEQLKHRSVLNEVYVIGGSQIYNEFLKQYPDKLKLIFQTYIEKEFESDVFYELPKEFVPLQVSKTFIEKTEPDAPFDFRILLNPEVLKDDNVAKNLQTLVDPYFLSMYPKSEEYQYLEILRDIIENGSTKEDRTGTGTVSKFGVTMRYDCSESFPLLTTKDTFWRGIVEEL
jgi:dihydrofolate reductase/thymidylate synthase